MSAQPRAVDIHTWYRTGGIDWARTKGNFDVVGIRAVVGDQVDDLLIEHVDYCQAWDIPYFTYCIPSPAEDPVWQADFYLDQYGVVNGIPCYDIEPYYRGGPMVSEYQARKGIERVESKHVAQPWYYSNYAYTKAIGNPGWIKARPVFWAEYRYQFYPFLYKKFEPFLEKYPWWPPRWATSFGIDVTLHQFTDKGNAQYYLANAVTADPEFRAGIKSADLSVGLVDLDELLSLWDVFGVIPEPTDKEKLDDLWDYHPQLHTPQPTPPPDPEPSDVVPAVITKVPHTVAWAVTDHNTSGVPIVETNAFVVTNDASLKFPTYSQVQVRTSAITSDGGIKWFELYGVDTHGYPALYVHKDDVMKLG